MQQRQSDDPACNNPAMLRPSRLQLMADDSAVVQLWPIWVGGVRYKTVTSLRGTSYRLLRLPGSQECRIYSTVTNAFLASKLSQADGALLKRKIAAFRKSKTTNLNEIITEFDAAIAAGADAALMLDNVRIVAPNAYLAFNDIPGTPYNLVKMAGQAQYRIFDTGTGTVLIPKLTAGSAGNLRTVIVNLAAQGVAGLGGLIKNLAKSQVLGIPVDLTIARMNAIEANIRTVVQVRIQADHAAIRALYPGQLHANFADAFVSLEIPGSDPHKGGQVVAFINYRTLAGGNLRVVYKPGDLTIDRLLYNDANSVAQELGGAPGVVLANYHIESMPADALAAANPALAHYGYMEFVETGGPTTAAQVRSVYRSLGSNLAMAYVFGMRDIHHENFILKNDRIQFIDMEAATATFTGFQAMELSSLPGKLCDRIAEGLAGIPNATVAAWMPNQAALLAQIRHGFTRTLAAMDPVGAHGAQIGAHVTAMTQAEARFVPFPTNALQQLAGLFYGRLAVPDDQTTSSYDKLTGELAANTAAASGSGMVLTGQLREMLQFPVVKNAFHVGDVPFWTRRGWTIYGEDGARQVNRLSHPRLNRSDRNQAAANTRRAAVNAGAALADLVANALPLFDNPSAGILARHRALRQNA